MSSEAKASEPAGADGTPGEIEYVDVQHLGRPRLIAAWFAGDVLVDPGPSRSLGPLLGAIERRRPRALALTHIHLDHAGAAGTLARRFPELQVWVHARGAPHMIDPSKLLASAGRLYGDAMGELWGEVLPVPAERVRVLEGGERLGDLRVAYAPGHASHHVIYLHEPSGCAFTGDAAGVRIGTGPVLAPTPPPDVDLEAWERTLTALEGWRPERLAVTHFGPYGDVEAHLAGMREALAHARVDGALDAEAFRSKLHDRVAALADDATVAAYEWAMPPDHSHRGLARYLAGRS